MVSFFDDTEGLELIGCQAEVRLAMGPRTVLNFVAHRTWRVEPRDGKLTDARYARVRDAEFYWRPAPNDDRGQAEPHGFPQGWTKLKDRSPNSPRFFLVAITGSIGVNQPGPMNPPPERETPYGNLTVRCVDTAGSESDVKAQGSGPWEVSATRAPALCKISVKIDPGQTPEFYWRGNRLMTTYAWYSHPTTRVRDKYVAQAEIDDWAPDGCGALELK